MLVCLLARWLSARPSPNRLDRTGEKVVRLSPIWSYFSKKSSIARVYWRSRGFLMRSFTVEDMWLFSFIWSVKN
jgi:hypothetical protein